VKSTDWLVNWANANVKYAINNSVPPSFQNKILLNNEGGAFEYLQQNDSLNISAKYQIDRNMHLFTYLSSYARHLELFLKIFAIIRPKKSSERIL